MTDTPTSEELAIMVERAERDALNASRVTVPQLRPVELMEIRLSPTQRQALIDTMTKRSTPNRGSLMLHPFLSDQDRVQMSNLGILDGDMKTLNTAGLLLRRWILEEEREHF